MSIEAFTKFLDANPDVAMKVAACQNYNEVAEIAKANGISVTGAEITKHAAQLASELSDEALEAVAGGLGKGVQQSIIIAASAGGATAVSIIVLK